MNFKYKILLLLITISLTTRAADLKTGFVETVIAENLNPTAMDIAPDGRIFITEKDGTISIIEQGKLLETPFTKLTVNDFNEMGLNGICLDPNFDINGYIYIYHSVEGQMFNRVSRVTANGNNVIPNSQIMIFDIDLLSGSGMHNGGGLLFDKEGFLYISTGDGGYGSEAQSLNSTLGKILRINSDGTIPDSNPFYNDLEDDNRAIYSYGLRNPFTMSYNKLTGQIYANDVGGNQYEEINEITAGKNYGWPIIEGNIVNEQDKPSNYKDPIFAYEHLYGCAIIGSAFYTPELYSFPNKYHNKYIFGDYCTGVLSVFDIESQKIVDTLVTNLDRLVNIGINNKGDLFYLQRSGIGDGSIEDNTSTKNGTLSKISFTGSGKPYIALQPKNQIATVNDTVYFNILASGENPLIYQWYINGISVENNTTNTLKIKNPSLELNNAKIYCDIENNEGKVKSDEVTLKVTENTRPDIEILSPKSYYKYKAGETISFSGIATDNEDGEISEQNFTWKIDFHHDLHNHPSMDPVSGIKSGEFTIPKIGETDTNVWYRIYLTVEDSEGLSSTVYRDIHPKIIKINIVSEYEINFDIWHDGKRVSLPYEYYSVSGLTRILEAPFIFHERDKSYTFNSWENISDEKIIFYDTPDIETTLELIYDSRKSYNGDGLTGNYYASFEDYEAKENSIVRTDEQINFNWVYEPPMEGIEENNYYVEWIGYILPPKNGLYTFNLASDDGIRLLIDDQIIIDDWTGGHALTEVSGEYNFKEFKLYPIKIQYFEYYGQAQAFMSWSTKNMDKIIVPKSNLFTEEVDIETGTSIFNTSNSRKDVSLYPNPFEDELFIDFSDQHNGQIKVRIFNDIGQLVKEDNIQNHNSSIDNLNHLPAGNYIIQLTSNSNTETLQVTKLP